MEIYSVENLTFTYPNNSQPALRNLSFSIAAGQFVALCGPSGCGKTTLLRHLKPSLTPHGRPKTVAPTILFEGNPLRDLDLREQSQKIGFVMQSPDNQIVTDKVWHELAFGLESLGCDTPAIRRRVAEMASFFGIQAWFYKNVTELSGGQKQMLNLASIMAMQPSVLILDEPTSQLDPIAAAEFLDIVGKINRELGVTVILTEHRLEEVFPHADRVIVMDKGEIIADGTAREIGAALKARSHGMSAALPVPMRVYAAVDSDAECPVTVREGKDWLAGIPLVRNELRESAVLRVSEELPLKQKSNPIIELKDVWFKYEKELPDVLRGLSFKAYSGEICAVLGGNGTGKTTALSLAAGLNIPYRGKVEVRDSIAALPQNPQSVFVKKTVEEDLLEILDGAKLSKEEKYEQVQNISALCALHPILKSHPYDLSGGEQQRAALAKVLLLKPKILLLDEPTKGLDAEFKRTFAGILRDLTKQGVCIVIVSHDIEFCAEYADRCALFFDGGIVSEGEPRTFFSGNSFYTTAANRMARHILPQAITANDIICAIGGDAGADVPVRPCTNDETGGRPRTGAPTDKLPKWRICTAIASGIVLIAAMVSAALGGSEMLDFISGGDLAVNAVVGDTAKMWQYAGIIVAALLSVVTLGRSLTTPPAGASPRPTSPPPLQGGELSKRTISAAVMILLAIPLTIYIGWYLFGDRKYYFVSMLIILETMLPFALVFESRKPQARELITIAALCAIAVAGRAAFFMLPQFKPVTALVIIAGAALGGEAGFLVGAMTGFVSNMFFGQGPWTPYQMFAFGIIGFLAGVCFRKGLLARSRFAMCVFGFLAALIIYGGIMNPASVLMFQPSPTKEMFCLAYLQGLPFDLVHAAATVTFLAAAAKPMLEKLDRIKVKYGLVSNK